MEWNQKWTAPAVGAVSFAAGAGLSYLVAKKRYQTTIDELGDAAFQAMQSSDSFRVQLTAAQTEANRLHIALEQAESTLTEFKKEALPEPSFVLAIPENIDVDGAPPMPIPEYVWSPDDDVEERSGDGPYILHQDEFFANQKGYRQLQLEWYEGDKILADEQQKPIYGPEKVVGHLYFGRGSYDPDVVYIRNDANKAEYEIHRNTGHYLVEVLGETIHQQAEDDELRHSQRIHRFKLDD